MSKFNSNSWSWAVSLKYFLRWRAAILSCLSINCTLKCPLQSIVTADYCPSLQRQCCKPCRISDGVEGRVEMRTTKNCKENRSSLIAIFFCNEAWEQVWRHTRKLRSWSWCAQLTTSQQLWNDETIIFTQRQVGLVSHQAILVLIIYWVTSSTWNVVKEILHPKQGDPNSHVERSPVKEWRKGRFSVSWCHRIYAFLLVQNNNATTEHDVQLRPKK